MYRFLILFILTLLPQLLAKAHIGYLYPAGAQQGSTLYVTVGGQDIKRIEGIYCTEPSITCEKVSSIPQLSPIPQFQRKWIEKAFESLKNETPIPTPPLDNPSWKKHYFYENLGKLKPHELDIAIRDFFSKRNVLQMSPSINNRAFLKLRIPDQVKPGKYELRVITREGVSNPLPFFISTKTEIKEPYSTIDRKEEKEPLVFPIPSHINGQIFSGEEQDSYTFHAEKDELITFVCHGEELYPYQGDCVPGHFQPIMEITEEDGTLLLSADDYYFHADPIIEFIAPKKGVYQLHIKDALYRGRADFVYRIDASSTPYTYPLYSPESLNIPTLSKSKESPLSTQLIQGVIAEPGATKEIPLTLKKGDRLIAEVYARRLNSPLDSILMLKNKEGSTVAFNDDHTRFPISELPQNTDSYLNYTVTEDGNYILILTDRTNQGGADYAYTLHIRPPQPRADLYLSTTASTVKADNHTPLEIILDPKDQFNEAITLSLEGDQDQSFIFTGPTQFPAGTTHIATTLSTKDNSRPGLHKLKLIGTSSSGQKIVAVPCEIVTQAFASTHYLPAEEWIIKTLPATPKRIPIHWEQSIASKINLAPGTSLTLIAKFQKNTPAWSEIKASLLQPKEGLTLTSNIEDATLTFTIKADSSLPSGFYPLIIELTGKISEKEKRNILSFTLPALLLHVHANEK